LSPTDVEEVRVVEDRRWVAADGRRAGVERRHVGGMEEEGRATRGRRAKEVVGKGAAGGRQALRKMTARGKKDAVAH
jgi:hypothetical protein